MFETPPNEKIVTLKLKRRYVVDLLVACTACSETMKCEPFAKKWDFLHEVIQQQLQAHDEKQEAKT